MKNLPLCFVLMPFGVKTHKDGRFIDFDAVYAEIIAPAIVLANLEPLRADEEKTGGIIHKAMFERLILCDYAIADLTTANANVFYELGVRHATKPATTSLLFAQGYGELPFDVNSLRGLPYELGSDGKPCNAAVDKENLANKLLECRHSTDAPATDSPIYQLLQDYPDIQHLKTDTFREQAIYNENTKSSLASARNNPDKQLGTNQIQAIQNQQNSLNDTEPGILIDLLLSYRAMSAWPEMINLVTDLPKMVRNTLLVQEQYAFALNRNDQSKDAEAVLVNLISEHGASSETFGLLGRVYKDRWQKAVQEGKNLLAKGYLNQAIETYLKGFESDWRDAYPGVNAINLMQHTNPKDPRQVQLVQVVSYAVERKIAKGSPDYWDYATLLELKVISGDEYSSYESLSKLLTCKMESWQAKTTINNLKLIIKSKADKGENINLVSKIVNELSSNI